MLDNLEDMTKSLMSQIVNQTPIASSKLLEAPQYTQVQLKEKAQREVQSEKIIQTELLQTTPSLGIRKVNVENEAKTL